MASLFVHISSTLYKMPIMTDGQKLKLSIRGKGLTVERAADMLGISRASLQSYYNWAELSDDIKQNVKNKLDIDIDQTGGSTSKEGQMKAHTDLTLALAAKDEAINSYKQLLEAKERLLARQDELIEALKSQHGSSESGDVETLRQVLKRMNGKQLPHILGEVEELKNEMKGLKEAVLKAL